LAQHSAQDRPAHASYRTDRKSHRRTEKTDQDQGGMIEDA
jgi:hypothetical protein